LEPRRALARLRSGPPARRSTDHNFSRQSREFAAKLGVKNAALSLSHTSEQAIAQVILES
jgi:phosphopantetheinyl transferase (holo-ACP synthase)